MVAVRDIGAVAAVGILTVVVVTCSGSGGDSVEDLSLGACIWLVVTVIAVVVVSTHSSGSEMQRQW